MTFAWKFAGRGRWHFANEEIEDQPAASLREAGRAARGPKLVRDAAAEDNDLMAWLDEQSGRYTSEIAQADAGAGREVKMSTTEIDSRTGKAHEIQDVDKGFGSIGRAAAGTPEAIEEAGGRLPTGKPSDETRKRWNEAKWKQQDRAAERERERLEALSRGPEYVQAVSDLKHEALHGRVSEQEYEATLAYLRRKHPSGLDPS